MGDNMGYEFSTKEQAHNWRLDKLHLNCADHHTDGFFDLIRNEIYVEDAPLHFKNTSLTGLPICYGKISKDAIIIIGSGDINSFMRYTRESNGYPVAPWDDEVLKKVFMGPGIEIDDFNRCTFRGEPDFEKFEIEKVREWSDPEYYSMKLTYEELTDLLEGRKSYHELKKDDENHNRSGLIQRLKDFFEH